MHDEQGKSGGFLSKVMHLVRGVPAAPGALSGSEVDSASHRAMLREVVERKRRNDAIRQQEFAQLRQLRQRGALAGQAGQALATRAVASFLPSVLGHDVSSSQTLQKIDEIEAQMSGQWWHPAAQAGSADPKTSRTRKPVGKALSQIPVLGDDHMVGPRTLLPLELSLTEPMVSDPAARLAPELAPAVVAPCETDKKAVSPQSPTVVPRVFKPHPDLEEAAILFAHGDMYGARTRLLEQLVQALNSAPVDEEKVAVLWHAALDWCRATGDEETFEPLAIDYAEHFGRSAPMWISIPARLGLPALYGQEVGKVSKRQVQWSCPAMLTVGAVTALRAAHQAADQPWSMSWVRLSSIDEAAVQPLTLLLEDWASSTGQFVLSDAGKLLELLQQHSVLQDRNQSPQWWVLRMAVLRLMFRMDEYEQVALDYCITYEVSPPSWAEPRCVCVVQETGEADVSLLQEASQQSTYAQSQAHGAQPVATVALSGLHGVMEGDAQERLDTLLEQVQQQNSKVLDVACDHLIRLDFVAAGGVLNWAADLQSQGYTLRFQQVHQLVAVFFHIIGIQEHATIEVTHA